MEGEYDKNQVFIPGNYHTACDMKASFIFAPFWETKYPPIGIAALKSYLHERGHEVDIFDYNIEALPIMYGYQDDIISKSMKIHLPFSKVIKFDFMYFIVEEFLNYVLHKCGILDDKKYFEATCYHFSVDYAFKDKEELEYVARSISVLFYPLFDDIIGICNKKAEELINKSYDFIGCSCNNFNLAFSILFLKIIKERKPSIKTILGGFQATLIVDTLVKRCPWLDYIVIGEGEELIARLFEKPETMGQVISQEALGIKPLDMNHLPYPDFSDLNIYIYQYLPIEGSRSCVYKCTFCREAQYWGKYRMKTGKRIREEMQYQADKYGKTNFFFTDSLTNPVAKELVDELIDNDCRFTWAGQFRIMKDPDLLNKLAKAGLKEVYYGMESASQRILNLINKQNKVEDMKEAVIRTALAGIRPVTYWIAGFPTETEEDFDKTINFILEMKDYIYVPGIFPFSLLKGASVDYMCNELGVKINDRLEEIEEFHDSYDFSANPTRAQTSIRVMRGYSKLVKAGFNYDFLSGRNNLDKFDEEIRKWENKREKILTQHNGGIKGEQE